MFSAAFEAAAHVALPATLSGTYALYDDGWRSKLVLAVDAGGADRPATASARYISYDRFRGEYPAKATFDAGNPRLIRISVNEFNELDEQTYVGLWYGGPPTIIAGVTHWREQPFGFFAHRGIALGLAEPSDRPLTAAAFAGAFRLHAPGLRADVELAVDRTGQLSGTIRTPALERDSGGSQEAPLTGSIDERVPHLAQLAILDGGQPVTMALYLFSHSFAAMAGHAKQGGNEVGCYLTRYR